MSVSQVVVTLTPVQTKPRRQGRWPPLPAREGRSLASLCVLRRVSGQDRRLGRELPAGRSQVRVWTCRPRRPRRPRRSRRFRQSLRHGRSRRPHLPVAALLVPVSRCFPVQVPLPMNRPGSVRSRNLSQPWSPFPSQFPHRHQHQHPHPSLQPSPSPRLSPSLFPSRVLLQPMSSRCPGVVPIPRCPGSAQRARVSRRGSLLR